MSTSETTARLSVIVPAYNEAACLGQTLREIRAAITAFSKQPGSAELIVVDDQSTDDTRTIALELADRVMTGPRAGIGACRNAGANAAAGQMFVFVDADTSVPKDLLTVLDSRHRGGARLGAVPPIYVGTTILMRVYFAAWAAYAKRRGMVQGVCQFIDRELFFDIGGYNEGLMHAEDNDLHQRALTHLNVRPPDPAVAIVTELAVNPSMRRYEQSSFLWLLLKLNPITTRVSLGSSKSWRRWYENPPR